MKTRSLGLVSLALTLAACGIDRLDIDTVRSGSSGSESVGGGAEPGGASGDKAGAESSGGVTQTGGGGGLVEGGAAGAAGTGGESGSAGTGGESGSAGTGGESGSADTGGESGSAGTGGESGSAGTGGESGSVGTGGESGSVDTGGEGGAADTGGEGGAADTGGVSGAAGTGGEPSGGVGGNATCPEGFAGVRCDRCERNYFGADCQPCDCGGGICSDGPGGDGTCSCGVGWDGDHCELCDVDYFGAACEACLCVNGKCDDGIDGAGSCKCDMGWDGPSCAQCEPKFWGADCSPCQCEQGTCDDGASGTGACSCDVGWAQPNCDTCESGYYGSDCLACSCGGGTCNDGSMGDGTCSDCPVGFLGDACDQCEANRHGASCELCTCVHGTCNEGITGDGSCACATGWDGPNCDVCAPGYYGTQCAVCPSGATAGCPCSNPSELACAAAAQKVQLMCVGGLWQFNATCSATQNCDQANGACATIVAGCSGQTGGYTFCEEPDIRHSCGVDLVTTTQTTCSGLCSQGDCVAPTCGDGKVQTNLGEECDDANQEPADDCEADCQQSQIVKIAMGGFHSCALLVGGYVRCWGGNEYNQLGQGNSESQGTLHPYQLPVLDLGGSVRDIDAGSYHTCAVLTDDTVRCWGRNDYGQLGKGDTTERLTSTPNAIGSISVGGAVSEIAVGGNISCARLTTGSVRCWGNNGGAGLGLGNTTEISSTQPPANYGPISLGGNANGISVGSNHVCALLADNTVRCWGYNSYGQLGRQHSATIGDTELPSDTDPNVPVGYDPTGLVPLVSGKTPRAVEVGAGHSCVSFTDNTLECWGANNGGQLGLGHSVHIADGPDESPALFGAVSVGTGGISQFAAGGAFSCGYFASGAIRCWGLNTLAMLGQPNLTSLGNTVDTLPSMIPELSFGSGLSGVGVYAGGTHTCVRLSDGRVRCWGNNNQGQLGMAYVSISPTYVGGSSSLTPDLLPSLAMFTATR